MRTTLTIDEDVAAALRAEMRKTGQSLKETVNRALRSGLDPLRRTARIKPFRVRARPLGRRPGLDYDRVSDLLEQIEGPLSS